MRNLFLVSFSVYILVNMVENLIHYNIGKYSDHTLKIDLPTKQDWLKIIFVMITFATLQGILTCYIEDRC